MKTQTKTLIKNGLIAGIVYAGLMAGYDYFNGDEFKIFKFIFHCIFFGGFMSLIELLRNKK